MEEYGKFPSVQPWELDALADGVITPNTSGLVLAPEMEARLKALSAVDERLSALYWRSQCPDPAQLLNYAWDLLPPAESLLLANHLLACPDCLQEAARLSPTEERPTAQHGAAFLSSMKARLTVAVGRLMPESLRPVAVRRALGDEDSHPQIWLYTVEALGCDVVVNQWRNPNATYTIQGQVLGLEARRGQAAQATVIEAQTIVASAEIEAAGVFQLDNVPALDYTLCLHAPTWQIFLPARTDSDD